ncbi:hypothetical protein [Saccharothrix sp.]|uniref:hypothetical protein n=1 Tax=Saccharothrix sp. TaxID=1873460 RepID=UPI002811F571|nr:hypothetical protein [Saccharothrix sp.]
MAVGAFGRAVLAGGLVLGSCVVAAPGAGALGPMVPDGARAVDGPSTFKAVIDEKVTKEADGYAFTGTVACPEQESPVDFTKVVLVVTQGKAVAKAEGDEVECEGEQGRAAADGKWKVLVKQEQESRESGGMKPGEADAYVFIVQGTMVDIGKGAVTLPE